MKFSNNNQSKAAKILGINRTTLRTKLKKYNIC
jgi:Fis family transcriptional regulator